MGAWGAGPFDSDAGLDMLATVREEAGAVTDADQVVQPGSGDQVRVSAALSQCLGQALEEPAEAYAAAGLVAATVTGQSPVNTGTGLFTGSPGLGLDRHAGFVGLLEQATAETLRPSAAQTVQDLAGNSAWLATWRDRDTIAANLSELATLLQTQ